MPKYSIIPQDKTICRDGVVLIFNPDTGFGFPVDPKIHAIQWDGSKGHIEYNDGTPNRIVTHEEVLPYAEAFDAEYARIQAERAAAVIEASKPNAAKVAAEAERRMEEGIVLNGQSIKADNSTTLRLTELVVAYQQGYGTKVKYRTKAGAVLELKTEPEVITLLRLLSEYRRDVIECSASMQVMNPIPEDFESDAYWPSKHRSP